MKARSLTARANGKAILEAVKSSKQYTLYKEDYHKYGGKENILAMYADFYKLFMTDPMLNVLFDMRDPDTAVGYP